MLRPASTSIVQACLNVLVGALDVLVEAGRALFAHAVYLLCRSPRLSGGRAVRLGGLRDGLARTGGALFWAGQRTPITAAQPRVRCSCAVVGAYSGGVLRCPPGVDLAL